nr:PAS domain S-box protein [Rubrobacter marinus]
MDRHSKHPPHGGGAWLARYGSAILAVVLALLLQLLLVPLFGSGPNASPFMMFFAAVMVAAYLGGLGPGLVATALSALLSSYFLLSPQYSLQLIGFGQGLRLLVFVLEGAVISLLVEAMHSAGRRLHESEERYRSLVESAEDYAILMLDPEGRVANWNAGAERLFGYREDEILGEPGSLLFVPEDVRRGAPEAELMRAEVEGRAEDERWHLRKDGSRFWASGFVRPMYDGEGRLRGFSKVARDMTEHKEANERARFLADLNHALQPLTDPDELTATAARMLGEHLDADRCAYAEVEADEDHFRITGDYARGMPGIAGRFAMSAFGTEALRLMRENEPYVVRDAEADERVSAGDLEAYRQTSIRAVVSVPLHKAGRFVAGMAVHQATPRRWSDEEVELVRTVAERCWESIERARAVRDLRGSEERFRTLADNISQLAWMADEKGWIFWYNKRWFEYTGTTLEEMQGWGWREVHHPDHVERVTERVQRSWDSGEPWEDTFPLRGKDGAYRWFLSRARPIRDEDGGIVRWFGTNTDVTEQREAEEALRQSEERYRAVIEQSAEGIYLVDADTLIILEANPAFRGLLGYDAPEELVGRDVHELIALPREEVDEAVRLTLGRGAAWSASAGTGARTGRWWRWRWARAWSPTAAGGSSAPWCAT